MLPLSVRILLNFCGGCYFLAFTYMENLVLKEWFSHQVFFWGLHWRVEDLKSFSILFCFGLFLVYLQIHWKILLGFCVVLFSHKFVGKVTSMCMEADATKLFLLALGNFKLEPVVTPSTKCQAQIILLPHENLLCWAQYVLYHVLTVEK